MNYEWADNPHLSIPVAACFVVNFLSFDPETPPADAKRLLHENLDGDLQFHRVSREVNSTRGGNHVGMIEPVNPL